MKLQYSYDALPYVIVLKFYTRSNFTQKYNLQYHPTIINFVMVLRGKVASLTQPYVRLTSTSPKKIEYCQRIAEFDLFIYPVQYIRTKIKNLNCVRVYLLKPIWWDQSTFCSSSAKREKDEIEKQIEQALSWFKFGYNLIIYLNYLS